MSREVIEVYADWHPIEEPMLLGLLLCLIRMITCVTTVFY